jgi:ABC-2 type transport system permease protein
MKIWAVAWKDIVSRFRNRTMVVFMLAAPILIAAIMGAAFGGFNSSTQEAPIQNIAFTIVNRDAGTLGEQLVSTLQGDEFTPLLQTSMSHDLATAQAAVLAGEQSVVLDIPPDFSANVQRIATGTGGQHSPATIVLYVDPGAPVRAEVVNAIVTQVTLGFNAATMLQQIGTEQQTTLNSPRAIQELEASSAGAIRVNRTSAGGAPAISTNPLAFFVPSMALFFLLFTMFDHTRSLYGEQINGTLSRMLTTPTSVNQILIGKIGGAFLTGILQLTILIIVSRLLFNVSWGSSIGGLALMTITFTAAASAIGTLITALTRDVMQANFIGGILTLLSSFLGGNFFSVEHMPGVLQWISFGTINRWGLSGFTDLTLRGLGLIDILPEAGVLLSIALVCFIVSGWLLPRRFAR